MSKVCLVGAGPGDINLMTIKGKEMIERADCIIYDRLASRELLELARENCELIFAGKENHKHVMKQEDINILLEKKAREYELVVRLKGGDPYVFGRGGEEILFLKNKGIEVDLVPGVTSVTAVPAYAGIPVTHRGVSKGFQVITAHSKKDAPSDIDYSKLTDPDVTLVFLMGLAHVGEIAKNLILTGRSKDTKAAVISNGTTAKQAKCIGTLETIDEKVKLAALQSPSIIVVGNVVGLSEELDFLTEKKLSGEKIVVPYIERFHYSYGGKVHASFENRLVNMLRDNGAEVYARRVGRIIPIENELTKEELNSYNWLIFTGANGVCSFVYNLEKNGLDIRSIGRTKIAVIGKKTAEVLNDFSIKADHISNGHSAEVFAKELGCLLKKEDKVLYVSALSNGGCLEEILIDKCVFEKKIFYENKICEFEQVNSDYDYICFTSASAVNRYISEAGISDKARIISMGASVSNALAEGGYSNYRQTEETSYESIVSEIINVNSGRVKR